MSLCLFKFSHVRGYEVFEINNGMKKKMWKYIYSKISVILKESLEDFPLNYLTTVL